MTSGESPESYCEDNDDAADPDYAPTSGSDRESEKSSRNPDDITTFVPESENDDGVSSSLDVSHLQDFFNKQL